MYGHCMVFHCLKSHSCVCCGVYKFVIALNTTKHARTRFKNIAHTAKNIGFLVKF